MKKIFVLMLFSLLTISNSFGQIFMAPSNVSKPIWEHKQRSYFNDNQNRRINVYVVNSNNSETVSFDISTTHEDYRPFETNISFFDIPKLIGALKVCAEALDEVSDMPRKMKKSLIEGMDTIFPRASIMWYNEDTLVASYNDILRPNIRYKNGKPRLIITGTAVCRVKFNDKMLDEYFAGDPNVITDYSLVFSSSKEINELIDCITKSVSPSNRVPMHMNPRLVFPRIIPRRQFVPFGINEYRRYL